MDIELQTPSWFEVEDGLEQRMSVMTFISDGKVLGRGWNWELLYLISPSTGEVVMNIGEYGSGNFFLDFVDVNSQLITFTSDGFEIYDLDSGRLLETSVALQEFSALQEVHIDGAHHLRLFPAHQEDSFYIVTRSGLYSYTFGDSEVEQLIDGAFNMMSNTGYFFGEVLALESDRFLISYIEREGRRFRLMDYTFSTDVVALPQQEMRVFSLFDNPRLRQAVSSFQSQTPHLLVHYEVGIMSEESSLTVSDAISTLNTQIMAGRGPDILFLDGMSYDVYIENGILLELTDLIEELKVEHDFFENILEYAGTDGHIYVVPTSFFLLLSTGASELLEETLTLTDLADLVEVLREQDGEIQSIIGYHTAESLLRTLIHYIYPQLYEEDGTMNSVVLADFLEYARRINDDNMIVDHASPPGVGLFWEQSPLEMLEHDIGSGIFGGLAHSQKINIGTLMHLFVFDQILSSSERLVWDYQVRDTFIPMETFGINSDSEHIYDSKDFLRFLFSSEVQSSAMFSGFPINIAGLEARKDFAGEETGSISTYNPEIGRIVLSVYYATVEEMERLIDEIERAETASTINRIILDAIIQDGVLFLDGRQSIEETIDGILMQVNLFLAE